MRRWITAGVRSAVLFLVVASQTDGAPYYALALGNSRTYSQWAVPDTSTVSFFIRDTLVDTFTRNGLLVYENNNEVWLEGALQKVCASPVSYWYERNDTVFAAEIPEDVGLPPDSTRFLLEVIRHPLDFGRVDTVVAYYRGESIRALRQYIELGTHVVRLGTFDSCVAILTTVCDGAGAGDTIQYEISAPRIGGIYFDYRESIPFSEGELVAYTIDGHSVIAAVWPREGPRVRHVAAQRGAQVFNMLGRVHRAVGPAAATRRMPQAVYIIRVNSVVESRVPW